MNTINTMMPGMAGIRRRRPGAGVAMVAAFALCPAAAGAVQLRYTIDAGIEDNDNVALNSTDRIHQTYFRTSLGFLLDEQSSSIQTSIMGRVDYRDYRDRLGNSVDGTLSGRFNWVALPQRLHFTVEDDLSVQPINSLAPDAPSNRQQINVLSAGPTLFLRSGESFHLQTELRFIDSSAEVTKDYNSRRVGLAIRGIKNLTPTSLLSFNLQGQRANFDTNATVRDYDRYEAYVRYARSLRRFDLGLDGGYAWMDYRDGRTATAPLLRASANWRLSERSRIDVIAASLLSDNTSDALAGIEPGSTVPETVLIGNALITSSAYRVHRVSAGYTYTGPIFDMNLAPYYESRDFMDPGDFDQKIRGATFNVGWRLRPTVTFDLFANQQDTDYAAIARNDRTRIFGASVQRDWTRHWSSRLELSNYRRTSSGAGQAVRQNIIYLSISYNNR